MLLSLRARVGGLGPQRGGGSELGDRPSSGLGPSSPDRRLSGPGGPLPRASPGAHSPEGAILNSEPREAG